MTEPLNVTTSPRDDHQLDVTIEMGPERTEQALQRAAKQVAKRANIPGFRRGKAPYAAVLRTFGREALLNEVLDDLGQEAYKEALDSEQIEPYGQAALVDVEMDPLTFKLRVPLPPTVELDDYRSIRVEAPEVTAAEADVDTFIEQRRAERASWEDVERPAEMGEMVVMDIRGTVGEDTIMDNEDWELILKADGGWLPGFDEAFIGVAAGEEKTFNLMYPEDSASRYKGQEATFQAKVKKVRAHVLPELNDEFAKSLGEYEDLADLRAKLEKRFQEQREAEAKSKLNDAAISALIEKATLSYPPTLVDETVEEMVHDLEHRLSDIGYKLEDYLRLQGTTLANYAATLRPQAEQRVKGRLVLGKLTEEEAIKVSAEEIDKEIARLLEGADERPQAGQVREFLNSEQGRQIIERDLLTEKTLERLRAIVAGEPVPPAEQGSPAAEAAEGKEAGQEEGEPSVEASSET